MTRLSLALTALASLLLSTSAPLARGQDAGAANNGGIAGAIAGLGQTTPAAAPATPVVEDRDHVNQDIKDAMVLEQKGDFAGEVARLQATVRASNFQDAKARYFLARAYRLEADSVKATDPAKAASDMELANQHERGAIADAATSSDAEDKDWAKAARDQLEAFSSSTPVLDQYAEGGSYPYGYCGITSLRMVLQLEGLPDPGADAVALQGAAPYIPGSGSDGALLAQRAQQLGLTNAQFSTTASLADIVASAEDGRPVPLGGEGPFSATITSDGSTKARSYPAGHWLVVTGATRDAKGQVTSVILNDPDGGHRESMTVAAFKAFFGEDGTIWDVTYTN